MREMDGDEMVISRQAAGVFDGKNMTLYTYCHHNPMILVDPDGKEPIAGVIAGSVAAYNTYVSAHSSGSSVGASAMAAAFSGTMVGLICSADPTDVFAAMAIGVYAVAGGRSDFIAQVMDLLDGNSDTYNMGSTIGSTIGGAMSGGASKAIGVPASESFGSIAGEAAVAEIYGLSSNIAGWLGGEASKTYGKGIMKLPDINEQVKKYQEQWKGDNGVVPVPLFRIEPNNEK